MNAMKKAGCCLIGFVPVLIGAVIAYHYAMQFYDQRGKAMEQQAMTKLRHAQEIAQKAQELNDKIKQFNSDTPKSDTPKSDKPAKPN